MQRPSFGEARISVVEVGEDGIVAAGANELLQPSLELFVQKCR
jgi:hypothetical protein